MGFYPPEDYSVTLAELRNSVLVNGCGDLRDKHWDKDWRNYLVDNLEIMANQLWKAGIDNIFIDGSFAENKDHPNDIDGYFECDLMKLATGELQTELNLLDEHKIWTWDETSRRPYRGYPKDQLPMWHQYRVELYPFVPNISPFRFDEFFRKSRMNDEPKGIIKLQQTGGEYD